MSNEDTSAATRAVVDRMLEAITKGDGEALMACLSPDLSFWMPGSTEIHGAFESRDEFAKVSADVMGRLSEPIALTVQNIIVDGERAAVQAKGSSRTKKGEPYNNTYCFIWRVQGGLITEMTEYHDTDLVRRVLLA